MTTQKKIMITMTRFVSRISYNNFLACPYINFLSTFYMYQDSEGFGHAFINLLFI